MRLRFVVAAVVALAVGGCGGSSDPNPSGPSPGPPGGGPGGAASTIAIVRTAGSQSFAPNPGTAPQGTTVAWRNNDSQIHRIVMNDGSLDTGEIRPGESSAALTMATNGGNYHCTIHPEMVGSIRAASGAPPPCTGLYCE